MSAKFIEEKSLCCRCCYSVVVVVAVHMPMGATTMSCCCCCCCCHLRASAVFGGWLTLFAQIRISNIKFQNAQHFNVLVRATPPAHPLPCTPLPLFQLTPAPLSPCRDGGLSVSWQNELPKDLNISHLCRVKYFVVVV